MLQSALAGRFVAPHSVPHTRRLSCAVKAKKENIESFVDYYDVLQVDPDASVGEIKFNFRRLQKQYHPDISGEEETSSVLNRAYQTLIDPHLRQRYDRRLSSVPLAQKELKRSYSHQPGIVGPLSDAELVLKDTISAEHDTMAERVEGSVVWLREWAKTFMFASDLPLPLPLQCDEIENGVRLAFITVYKNRIRSAGDLHFVVEEASEDTDLDVLYVAVYRVVPSSRSGLIPGEYDVMKAFQNALRDKNEVSDGKYRFLGFELSGFAAATAAQFMPALVTLPLEKIRGSSYEAYHLKHPTTQ